MASAGDLFSLGHRLRPFEVALLHSPNRVCISSIGLEKTHLKHELEGLVGASSCLYESRDTVVPFPKGAPEEK